MPDAERPEIRYLISCDPVLSNVQDKAGNFQCSVADRKKPIAGFVACNVDRVAVIEGHICCQSFGSKHAPASFERGSRIESRRRGGRDLGHSYRFLFRGADGRDDPEAYDLYIRGRYLWNKRIDSEIFRSIELFRAAIDKDPAFAKAYVALANSYSLVGLSHYGISDEERANLAIATAEKAIELDETLGEAYAVKAVNKSFIKWDLAGADSDYRRAIELDPNDATAHHWYAEFLAMHGRFDESLALYHRAMEFDPLSSAIRTDYALTFYYTGDFDRAIELLNKEKVLHPSYARTYLFLYFIYPEKGMYAEALDAMETHVDVVYRAGGRSVDWYEDLKAKLAKRRASLTVGARGFWERTLIDAENEPYPTAVAYAKLGDKDRAFEYLEKAFAARYTGMVWLKVTPELDSLRDDPRFDTLLRRVGFE